MIDELINFKEETDASVFIVGTTLTAALVVFLSIQPTMATNLIKNLNSMIISNFAWYFQGFVFALVIFFIFSMVGPWGRIKLGKPGESPEYSFTSYISMVFAATFGAGLVFWGPAEALFHYETVPPLVGAKAESNGAMIGAMQYSLFHWGISPWVGHLILSVPLAYYVHKKDAPLKPSSVLAPFIDIESNKILLKTIDTVAVVSAAGGATVTVGLAGQQFVTGLAYNYGINIGDLGIILLITGLSIGYIISAVVGIQKGIRRLSLFNVALFILLLVVIFIASPIASILNIAVQGLGEYISGFVRMSLFVDATGNQSWIGAWTVFYWAWWISFAPMTGIFIARISRGRTIRQVIFAAMIAGTAATLPWFITMGGFALILQHVEGVPLLSVVSQYGEAVAAYPILEQIPFGNIFIVLFMILVFTFLITTIDSATISLAIFTTDEGTQNPSAINRVIWGALIGLLTSYLLVSGGVSILQKFTIIAGFPIAALSLFALIGFIIQLEKAQPILLTQKGDVESIEKASRRVNTTSEKKFARSPEDSPED